MDLEQHIRNFVAAKEADAQRVRDKKARKMQRTAFNRAAATRSPMFRPDPPPNYRKVVVLNVRRLADGMHGDLLTVEYPADTVLDSVAELEAKTRAKADGYVWRGTVDIRQGA